MIGDPEKRKVYDSTGGTHFNQGGGSESHFKQDFNYHDFYREFDEAMKNHHKNHNDAHKRAQRDHMRRHRENVKRDFGFDINFDDLFDDEMFNLFGESAEGGNGDLNEFGAGESFFEEGSISNKLSNNLKIRIIQLIIIFQVSINSQDGKTCKTVKKTQGNTVTTYTECS